MKVEDGFHSKNIDKAREKLDLLNMEETQRKAYLKYMEDIAADKGALAAAKEEGIEEGEKKKAVSIARNLLDVLDTKTIAKKTGLTEEEVEKLREIP
jgi:predicted transposase/invertase (TIGR01784 family)